MAKRLGATQLVPIWHVMRWFSTRQRRRLGVFLFGSSPSWGREPLVAIHKISFQSKQAESVCGNIVAAPGLTARAKTGHLQTPADARLKPR